MTALTKEQIDALPGLVAEIEKQHPLSAIRAESVHKLQMLAPSLAATVIEQQAEIERLRGAGMDAAKIAESCAPSDEWAEETKDTYLFAVRDVARAIRKHSHDRAATNALGNIAHAVKEDGE